MVVAVRLVEILTLITALGVLALGTFVIMVADRIFLVFLYIIKVNSLLVLDDMKIIDDKLFLFILASVILFNIRTWCN